MKLKILIITFFLPFTLLLQAQIKVAPVLGDNMVMQRNTEVRLWGTAKPNDKLTITVGWNGLKVNTVSNAKGEWLVTVKTTEAGGPYSISVSNQKQTLVFKNILLGEVWLCSGQSNMEMPVLGFLDSPVNGSNDALLEADNNDIRFFTVKNTASATPNDTCIGKWSVASAETVGKFSAVGYFFAKQLQSKLNVPVGMICSSWGGSRIEAWISKDYMIKYPEPLKLTTKENLQPKWTASQLYNGMISPIKNYVFKGVLWYQGENNRLRDEYQYYTELMKGLVENWRNDFGIGQFPFYFVQIAPYWYNNSKDILSGKFCDQQMKASLTIPNCGMVVTTDLGEEKNIHPAEKAIVGKRLAFWAFSETYGIKGINCKNTYFKSAVAKDSTMIVSFENASRGITSFGKELTNFQIAGEDKVFYPAKASIVIGSSQLKVWATEVKVPVSVRYGYCNFPQGTGFLYNTAGLPVPSFRSDNWGK